mgnify:CR=1 FL=1
MRQLPPPLRLEASQHLRLELLKKSDLAKVVHPSALGRLTLEMDEVVVPPGELLLLEGDVCSRCAYIVVDGQFEVLATIAGSGVCTAAALVDYAAYTNPHKAKALQEKKTQALVVATLTAGATLGAASFLLADVPPSATVRAPRVPLVLHAPGAQGAGGVS